MIVEFRIPMPMKVEEFDRGWLYMVAVASEEGTKAGDGGVVVLKNEAYDNTDGHLGVSEISGNVIPKNKGQYTLKQYFLGSRVPTWLTYVLPGTCSLSTRKLGMLSPIALPSSPRSSCRTKRLEFLFERFFLTRTAESKKMPIT